MADMLGESNKAKGESCLPALSCQVLARERQAQGPALLILGRADANAQMISLPFPA